MLCFRTGVTVKPFSKIYCQMPSSKECQRDYRDHKSQNNNNVPFREISSRMKSHEIRKYLVRCVNLRNETPLDYGFRGTIGA